MESQLPPLTAAARILAFTPMWACGRNRSSLWARYPNFLPISLATYVYTKILIASHLPNRWARNCNRMPRCSARDMPPTWLACRPSVAHVRLRVMRVWSYRAAASICRDSRQIRDAEGRCSPSLLLHAAGSRWRVRRDSLLHWPSLVSSLNVNCTYVCVCVCVSPNRRKSL